MSAYYSNIIFFRVVKLSSPNLNYIIIAGVALLYTSVFMYTYTAEEALFQTILCNVCRDMHISYMYMRLCPEFFSNSFDSGCSHLATLCALLCS